ncbi:MAG: hypothetical protein RR420_00675 [Anaerovoracaceae bacterium]
MSDLLLKDNKIGFVGEVTKKLICKATGKVISTSIDNNLVVKKGRAEMIKLLTGTSELVPGEKTKIKKMGLGKGGADAQGRPIAPTDGDVDVNTPIAVSKTDITSIEIDTNRTNPRVLYTVLFDCDVINSIVNECGLYMNDGTTLFAHHTFKNVPLEAGTGFALQISWSIDL